MPISIEGVKESVATARDLRELVDNIKKLEGQVHALGATVQQYAGRMATALEMLQSSEEEYRKRLVMLVQSVTDAQTAFVQTLHKTLQNVSNGFQSVTEAQRTLQDVCSTKLGDVQEQIAQMQNAYSDGQQMVIRALTDLVKKRTEAVNEEQELLRQAISRQDALSEQTARIAEAAGALDLTFTEYEKQSQQRTRLRQTVEAEHLLREGQLSLRSRHAMEAYTLFEKAHRLLKPGDGRGLLGMAAAMEQHGDDEQAEQLYTQAATRSNADTDLSARLALARFYVRHHRFEEGLKLLRQSVERYPSSAPVQKLLGVALYQTDQVEEAIAHLRRARTINPNDAELRALLLRLGETDHEMPQEVFR